MKMYAIIEISLGTADTIDLYDDYATAFMTYCEKRRKYDGRIKSHNESEFGVRGADLDFTSIDSETVQLIEVNDYYRY